jgi:crotonobetaine/carnitine-CoA ligase
MVSMLWNQPPDARDSQLPLRFISAAPIAADVYRDIEQRYGVRVVTMYGMTEAFPIAYKRFSEDGVPGTSGRVNPAFDVRIVDGDGMPVPAGSVGEITCRAKSANAMSLGYVDATAVDSQLVVTPHGDSFGTGDLGSFDDDGNLTYIDRAKDSLRRRGENVSSVEVETVVRRHPAVADAAVVGVPSELGEDDILVILSLRPGVILDCAELLDFCAARMPYFCVPRYVETVEELPKNGIGRIRKDILRATGLTPGAWDRERQGYIVRR